MRLFLIFTIILFITVPVFSIPNHVLEGAFASRSGQIGLGFQSDEEFIANRLPSATLFITNPLSPKITMEAIEDVQVADLLAHSLGLSPLSCDASIDRTQYPKDSIFSKATAALFVAIDGVTDEQLALSFGDFASLSVLPSYLSTSSLSTLETVFSAATPSATGIVADSWLNGKKSVSVGSPDGLPLTPSFADWLANSEARSLVVSASPDSRFASILATRSAHPNSKLVSPRPFSFELLSQFFPQNVQLTFENDVLQVTIGSVRAHFQLNLVSDLAFLNELQALVSLVNDYAVSTPATNDAFPDLYTVGFASTSSFLPTSAKHHAALLLIEAAFSVAVERFTAVYDGRFVSATIALHPLLPAPIRDACRALAQQEWVSEFTTSPLDQSCPDLYISQSFSDSQIAALSQQVIQFTGPQGASAFILPRATPLPLISHDVRSESNSTQYTADEVALFQITLWTSILLFLVLVAVLSGLFCLTWEGYDSQVFIESNSIQRNMIIGYKE